MIVASESGGFLPSASALSCRIRPLTNRVQMKPEVLPPSSRASTSRSPRAGALFDDQNLELLSHILDDCFRVPGTSIRFGLDGIIGLIPGLGDILAGLASCIIVFAAWVRGVPYVTLVRMIVNLGLDVIIGAIPILGDAFDIAWKANRRNYALLVQRLERPRGQTWRDWLFLSAIAAALLVIFLIPVVMIVWMVAWLRAHL